MKLGDFTLTAHSHIEHSGLWVWALDDAWVHEIALEESYIEPPQGALRFWDHPLDHWVKDIEWHYMTTIGRRGKLLFFLDGKLVQPD